MRCRVAYPMNEDNSASNSRDHWREGMVFDIELAHVMKHGIIYINWAERKSAELGDRAFDGGWG